MIIHVVKIYIGVMVQRFRSDNFKIWLNPDHNQINFIGTQ